MTEGNEEFNRHRTTGYFPAPERLREDGVSKTPPKTKEVKPLPVGFDIRYSHPSATWDASSFFDEDTPIFGIVYLTWRLENSRNNIEWKLFDDSYRRFPAISARRFNI